MRQEKKSHNRVNDDATASAYDVGAMEKWDADRIRSGVRAFMERRELTIPNWTSAAKIADSTLRNFLDGQSDYPRIDIWLKLAAAAKATVSEVIGEVASSHHDSRINASRLGEIAGQVETFLAANRETLTPDAKGSLIAVLYDLAEEGDREAPFRLTGTFENVIRLAVRGRPRP